SRDYSRLCRPLPGNRLECSRGEPVNNFTVSVGWNIYLHAWARHLHSFLGPSKTRCLNHSLVFCPDTTIEHIHYLPKFPKITFGSTVDPGFRSELLAPRSEEHTSELQSRSDLVCRLLLEKKNKTTN